MSSNNHQKIFYVLKQLAKDIVGMAFLINFYATLNKVLARFCKQTKCNWNFSNGKESTVNRALGGSTYPG